MSARSMSTVRCVWRHLTRHQIPINTVTCTRTTSFIQSAINHHINIQRNFSTSSSTPPPPSSSPSSPTATPLDPSSQAQVAAAHAAATSINQTIQQTPITPSQSPPQTPVNLNLPPTQAPKPGFLISDATVFLSDGTQETINDLLKSKRCLLLGFVGAFTRLDQQSFTSYAHKAAELKKKYGIDHVYALSVNDHSVLSAFKDSLSLQSYTGMSLIADFDARMTRWLGMEIDLSSVGFGVRSKRFAMLVDKQQVKVVRVESNVGLLDVTSLDSMTQVLKEMKKEEAERLQAQLEREAAEQSAAAAATQAASTAAAAAAVTATDASTQTIEQVEHTEKVETQSVEPITTNNEAAEQQHTESETTQTASNVTMSSNQSSEQETKSAAAETNAPHQ